MFENFLYTAMTLSSLLIFVKYEGCFKIFKNFVINLIFEIQWCVLLKHFAIC